MFEVYWQTLPAYVWVFYYIFILATLGLAILNIFRKKLAVSSVTVIVVTITVPIISVMNTIGRGESVNEFEHLVHHLQQGSAWAMYALIGYLYLIFYWGLFLFKKRKSDKTAED
ncbi:hypothetical protein [Mesobacillus foraminis]|uniref:Uncharacterized protein n=1 Tax=Mesobacillus foraminis TaxID=279826 RepID=A0A4R2BHZ1_9BACI|nr:hypothetical protein [Mesobacillus foraminis]TCN26516.1 hypothetical protein EV146_10337 [Mesobacillus foraminis]